MKLHMKKEIILKVIHFLAGLSLSVLLSACAAFQGAGDIAQGREAMFAGNYKAALGYFQGAEQVDPSGSSRTRRAKHSTRALQENVTPSELSPFYM